MQIKTNSVAPIFIDDLLSLTFDNAEVGVSNLQAKMELFLDLREKYIEFFKMAKSLEKDRRLSSRDSSNSLHDLNGKIADIKHKQMSSPFDVDHILRDFEEKLEDTKERLKRETDGLVKANDMVLLTWKRIAQLNITLIEMAKILQVEFEPSFSYENTLYSPVLP